MEFTQQEIIAALEWYKSAGVTESISNEQVNYYATPAITKATPTPQRVVPSILSKKQSTSALQAINNAKSAANAAHSLDALYEAINNFDDCPLKKTAMNTVTHDGQANGDIMVIGEAPGADEDRRGIPFCGASGQLLDKMFASIEHSRASNLYISNMIFWRPPGNRNPTAEELAICRPFVEKHIALVSPKLLVFVGGIAAKEMLQATVGITRLRGKIHHYKQAEPACNIPAFATLHPSYLLRQPEQKRLAWNDLLQIKAHLSD